MIFPQCADAASLVDELVLELFMRKLHFTCFQCYFTNSFFAHCSFLGYFLPSIIWKVRWVLEHRYLATALFIEINFCRLDLVWHTSWGNLMPKNTDLLVTISLIWSAQFLCIVNHQWLSHPLPLLLLAPKVSPCRLKRRDGGKFDEEGNGIKKGDCGDIDRTKDPEI